MCSMTTETKEPVRRKPFGSRSWSLTRRLIIFYTIATVTLLVMAAWFLDWGLRSSLDAQDRRMLASKVQVLRLLLREHHDRPDYLAMEVEHEASESQSLKYFMRVLDHDGRVLIETSKMQQLLPTELFPTPDMVRINFGDQAVRATVGGRPYLLLSANAVQMGPVAKKRVLQVGLDIEHNDELLATYRKKLMTVLSMSVVLAAIVGVAVSRAGMRPLNEISKAVQHITASKLESKIAADRWPVELAPLATAFDDMLDRLQASFNRLSECTGDMAHALRNPINNLRGEAEITLARERTPQEYQQVLISSVEETERLSRMIDSLLFIARADNPNTVLDFRPIEAAAEIEAVCEFYEALAAEKSVAVAHQGNATLHGDPMYVRRAISNLLANALKHTQKDGRILITATQTPEGGTEISVVDNGIGIPTEHLARVFDRFYQVDQSRGLTAKGAGLGLAIVNSIMRLHRGEVTVESTLGYGSTFRLKFPAFAQTSGQTPRAV